MKTINIQLYTIDELSPEAKAEAILHFEKPQSYIAEEAKETIKEIERVFPITVKDYDIGAEYIDFNINFYEEGKSFSYYQKQFKYPKDKECGLSGVHTDVVFLNELPKVGIIPKMKLGMAMDMAFLKWVQLYEEEFSDENIEEHIRINEYYFLEDGTMFKYDIL